MPGFEVNLSVQVALVVVPAAVYFLLLGMLNSRPSPQLLSGRTDFFILNAAFFPLVCVPVLNAFGAAPWTVLGAVALLLGAARLLGPARQGNWVVYNISLPEALRVAERALREMDEPFSRQGRRLALGNRPVTLSFSSVPLLRNVSISVQGHGGDGFCADFQARIGGQLSAVRAPVSAMATAFLLIATALLAAPLGVLANRMPEMVRLITDWVH